MTIASAARRSSENGLFADTRLVLAVPLAVREVCPEVWVGVCSSPMQRPLTGVPGSGKPGIPVSLAPPTGT